MKFIILAGNEKKGKTPTMQKVYDLLTKNMKNKPAQNWIYNNNGNKTKDFHCKLTYKGKEVAIFSAGDTMLYIFTAIFTYSDVDYLIISFRTTGSYQNNSIINEAKKQKQTVINKTVCPAGSNQATIDAANTKDSMTIEAAII